MSKEEYYKELDRLVQAVEFNESIHCHLVANRYRRELRLLIEENPQFSGSHE